MDVVTNKRSTYNEIDRAKRVLRHNPYKGDDMWSLLTAASISSGESKEEYAHRGLTEAIEKWNDRTPSTSILGYDIGEEVQWGNIAEKLLSSCMDLHEYTDEEFYFLLKVIPTHKPGLRRLLAKHEYNGDNPRIHDRISMHAFYVSFDDYRTSDDMKALYVKHGEKAIELYIENEDFEPIGYMKYIDCNYGIAERILEEHKSDIEASITLIEALQIKDCNLWTFPAGPGTSNAHRERAKKLWLTENNAELYLRVAKAYESHFRDTKPEPTGGSFGRGPRKELQQKEVIFWYQQAYALTGTHEGIPEEFHSAMKTSEIPTEIVN